ncbi:MAG: winged helix-turn-helix domain-containing protein [Candidatus Aenigmarchaeota archaeon]|nr:winged helix-turn-helix domain-containing protein [Candidatus Aenigmarchaeota archaeon]
MNTHTERVFKNKALSIIFFTLISENENGLNNTEISKKLKKSPTTISRQMDVLEKAGFVKIKLVDDNRLKKLYYPTLKPFFENIAKSFNVEFTQDDYDNIDNFLFYSKIKNRVFKISKDVSNVVAELPTVIFKVFAFIGSSEFQNMLYKDPELNEKFEKYMKTMSKIKILKF